MVDTLNVFGFFEKFPDEKACEDFIIRARWPRGVCCPHCGNYKLYRLEKQKRFKCGGCRKQFSVKTGSVLAESKVTLRQWLMAAWLLTNHCKGFSCLKLAKTLGVTQKTAFFLAHRICEAFRERGGLFNGDIEIDKASIGDIAKNEYKSKRLNAGRGAVKKGSSSDLREFN